MGSVKHDMMEELPTLERGEGRLGERFDMRIN